MPLTLRHILRVGSRLGTNKFASAQICSRRYHDQETRRPLAYPDNQPTVLPIVLQASNLIVGPVHGEYVVASRDEHDVVSGPEDVAPFLLSHGKGKSPLGYVKKQILTELVEDHEVQGKDSPWHLVFAKEGSRVKMDALPSSIAFADWVNENGVHSRTEQMKRLVEGWKENEKFNHILSDWNKEAYPVFNHIFEDQENPIAFGIQRAALPLFGFPNYGSLLTAYYTDPNTGELMLWIPRRSPTKRTFPGTLDVTVGGNIGLTDTPLSAIHREAAEEASLDLEYVRTFTRPAGMLSFPNLSPERYILPGNYFLYDLSLPNDGSITSRINKEDGEVEGFEPMDIDTVAYKLFSGEFKPSSALALVDFLIRHGYITPENDARYTDVCIELKREIGLPRWRNCKSDEGKSDGFGGVLAEGLSFGLIMSLLG